MKKVVLTAGIFTLLITGCKEKNEKPEEGSISALSIIKGQLNHLDTSLYQVMKFDMHDGLTDTTYLKREEVRTYADIFFNLPDISEKKYRKKYTEEKFIDAGNNSLSIISMAKDEKAEIQKQIIVVAMDGPASGNVQSIFIEYFSQAKDSSVQKNLYWEVDKLFQVGTIIQKDGQPEKSGTMKVTWQ